MATKTTKPVTVAVPKPSADSEVVGVSGDVTGTKETSKSPKDVKVFAVTGDTQNVVLTIDGQLHRFDAQQVLALRKLLDGAAININY